MRFLCVKQDCRANIFGEDFHLRPLDGQRQNLEDILVTDDFSASELLTRHRKLVLEAAFDPGVLKGFPKKCATVGELGRSGKALLIRNGGIGDHVAFLPVVQAIRKRTNEKLEISLSVQKEKHPIYRGMPGLKTLVSMPMRLTDVLEADFLMDFSGTRDEDFRRMHMTDYFLHRVGIPPEQVIDDEKAPRIHWRPERGGRIDRIFDGLKTAFPGKPLILLNWKASNALRNLPADKLLFLAERYESAVFIIAQPRETGTMGALQSGGGGKNIVDLTREMDSLESYMGVIFRCDAVVATDTGTGHLAEGLGKPSLILYGPTRDEFWIQYYQKVLPLRAEYRGETCCSPCGIQKSEAGCPEAVLKGTAYSPCLLSISRDRISRGFEEMMWRIEKPEPLSLSE